MDHCAGAIYLLSVCLMAFCFASIIAICPLKRCYTLVKKMLKRRLHCYIAVISGTEYEELRSPACCDARQRLHEDNIKWMSEMSSLQDELRKKDDALKQFKEAEADWKRNMSRLQDELTNEQQQKEDALKRLSAIMSSRLRDGNPNVADLNDQNRPTKVGEQFSELYDNQWTDAYGAIIIFFGNSLAESQIIQILLDILEHCYTECKAISKNQMDQLNDNVKCIAAIITRKHNRLPTDLMQRIKEERKMFALDKVPALESILLSLKSKFSSKYQDQRFLDDPIIITFVQECLKLSWLMVTQDPPMAIILKPEADACNNFKPYQTRGSVLSYIVWPALLLKDGGPLIQKGVAEFNSQ